MYILYFTCILQCNSKMLICFTFWEDAAEADMKMHNSAL